MYCIIAYLFMLSMNANLGSEWGGGGVADVRGQCVVCVWGGGGVGGGGLVRVCLGVLAPRME